MAPSVARVYQFLGARNHNGQWWTANGSQVRLGVLNDRIHILWIESRQRGVGHGTQTMLTLCDAADALGFSMSLWPSTERLRSFYARFGFTGNDSMMIRGK